jgi:Phospholipase_D-nuclease N-terminal
MNPEIAIVSWQLFLLFYLARMVLSIISIVKKKSDGNKKLMWVLITIFVPFGPFIYTYLGKKQLEEINF